MHRQQEDETKALIIEEFKKEAQAVENQLGREPLPEFDKEQLYANIMEKIHYSKTEELAEKKNKAEKAYARRKAAFTAVAAAFVMVFGIFFVYMSVPANRNYAANAIKRMVGNDVNIRITNDETADMSTSDEESAREEIEEKLQVGVPQFLYIPEGMKFQSYFIGDQNNIAYMYYEYQDKILCLIISHKDMRNSEEFGHGSKNMIERGLIGQYGIEIMETTEEGDRVPTYLADWEHNMGYYQLSGKIGLDIFEEVLSNMEYK